MGQLVPCNELSVNPPTASCPGKGVPPLQRQTESKLICWVCCVGRLVDYQMLDNLERI